jgi:hypothetical protein
LNYTDFEINHYLPEVKLLRSKIVNLQSKI